MEIKELELLWKTALQDILGNSIDDLKLSVLAKQTKDSIRRIDVYKMYLSRAESAVRDNLPFFHTSNPFVLAQRKDLSLNDRVWIVYLATYFGKSAKSGWTLFNRAVFDPNNSLIKFDQINEDVEKYFDYISSFDFFDGCSFSNHRKYIAKNLEGKKGVFKSMSFVIENIDLISSKNQVGIIHEILNKDN